MESSADRKNATVSLRAQLSRVWRHSWIVALCLVLGVGAGFAYAKSQPQKFSAKATVVVYPLVTDPNGAASANSLKVDIATEARIASSTQVATRAAVALRTQGVDVPEADLIKKVQSQVKVTGTSQTSVLDFEASSPNAQRAAQYANALSEAYLQVRKESVQSLVDERVKQLDSQASAAAKAQETEEAQKASAQKAQVQLTATTGGRIVSAASVPSKPSSLGRVPLAIAGGVLGLLLGAVLAYAFDRVNPRVRFVDRALEFGVPVFEFHAQRAERDAQLLLRAVGAADSRLSSSGLSGLAIMPVSEDAPSAALVPRLFTWVRRELDGSYARFADADLSREVFEQVTPEEFLSAQPMPVLLELDESLLLPLSLRVADAAGAVLVPISRRTSHAMLREMVSQLRTLERADVLLVFIPDERKG